MIEDESLQEVVLVTQLPSDSWFEGLCVSSNGRALATRLDKGELWSIDTTNPDAEAVLLHTFPDCNCILALCAMKGDEDCFFLVTANADLTGPSFSDFWLWKAEFSLDDSSPPKYTKMEQIPGVGLLSDSASVSDRLLLAADSTNGCIWRFDMRTGKSSMLLAHESMRPGFPESPFGISRVKVEAGYVWYTNTSTGTLSRFPVELTGDDVGIRATGPVEAVSRDVLHCDGFAITPDSAAYVVRFMDGELERIEAAKAESSRQRTVMRNLVSPAAIELVHQGPNAKPKLYIVCNGSIEIDWFKEDSENPWSDFANFNSAVTVSSVTVTEVS
ncbi:hypothetical protein F4778DRAFT_573583 [Xylariomycetidae sp. FL2044]|nr:hypothetical protein F4778DRAFT_573583 [Xylariomycetidae sp. FL2044]